MHSSFHRARSPTDSGYVSPMASVCHSLAPGNGLPAPSIALHLVSNRRLGILCRPLAPDLFRGVLSQRTNHGHATPLAPAVSSVFLVFSGPVCSGLAPLWLVVHQTLVCCSFRKAPSRGLPTARMCVLTLNSVRGCIKEHAGATTTPRTTRREHRETPPSHCPSAYSQAASHACRCACVPDDLASTTPPTKTSTLSQ